MGDVSIIARRLEDGNYVQYGWSGNGGYFCDIGDTFLEFYDNPEKVEYLFGLGQLRHIGIPGSEKGGESLLASNILTGKPHYLGKSEREILSKIMFVDYAYFYDTDNNWYYVHPGPFRIKIPLKYIGNHLNEDGFEFDERRNIQKLLSEFILGEYYSSDEYLQSVIKINYPQGREEILNDISEDKNPCNTLWKKYKRITELFDDWVVVRTDDEYKRITEFILRKKQDEDRRIETIDW